MENTNKLNSFNFNQDISKNAIGDSELFIFANKDATIKDTKGLFIKFTKLNKSVIEIDKDINNFDEFITILFHELGHYILHADNEDMKINNMFNNKGYKTPDKIEEQANLFAEHMRHIFYNAIELVKLSK